MKGLLVSNLIAGFIGVSSKREQAVGFTYYCHTVGTISRELINGLPPIDELFDWHAWH
jgi:hypothetical protein